MGFRPILSVTIPRGRFVRSLPTAAIETATELIDDAVYADDDPFTLTTSKMLAAGAVRDIVLSNLAAADGDVVPLRVGTQGALHITGNTNVTGDVHSMSDGTGFVEGTSRGSPIFAGTNFTSFHMPCVALEKFMVWVVN